MTITKTLGGERLGTGKKMQVRMHNFERSSHNLSREWKSSMNVGTLVPCFNEVGLPGDSFDIDIETLVKTQPTSGPLFGSFKMQIDMFACPIRLYNGALHNNALGVGLKMSEIEFPKINFNGALGDTYFNSSSLNAYLGLRGVEPSRYGLSKNGIRHIAYYDIFKNYYSNKQEKNAYYISNKTQAAGYGLIGIVFTSSDGKESVYKWQSESKVYSVNNGTEFSWLYCDSIKLIFGSPIDKPLLDTKLKNAVFNIAGAGSTSDYAFVTLPGDDKIVGDDGNYCTISGWGTKYITIRGNTTFWGIRAYLDKYRVGQLYNYATNCGVYSTGTEMGTTEQYEVSDIALKSFPLSNIDDMRESILSAGKGSVVTSVDSPEPYNVNSKIIMAQRVDSTTSYQQVQWKFKQFGLCVKTYLSDIFNNWLDSETITGDNGIAAVTAVDTSSGSFTIDSLILANKVYNMLNRIAVSGGTYDDWQEVVYGETLNFRAESPIYLGGMSREIYFDEIVSTADSTAEGNDVPLGSMAGKGVQSGKKGGKVSFRINEPSIIMGIVSLTPRIDYSQGNEWFMELKDIDELHKPNLDGIGFQDLMASQMFFSDKRAIGKQPAWINYMTSYNQNYGDFASGESLEHMVLNRNYGESDSNYSNIGDVTTYIDPRKYNYIFADSSLSAENFWVQIAFNVIGRRKMSAKIMPNL